MPFSISFSRHPAPPEPPADAPLDLDATLKIYDVFRDYLKHEDELRSTRTGWLLTSQAFLFAAIGTVLASKDAHLEAIGFCVELFIAVLGFLIALNHRQRANQQDQVYEALEANYQCMRDRLSPGSRGPVVLQDLPPLRYAGARTTIGAGPYSASYHVLFMLGWVVMICLLAGGHWHIPTALFPPATPKPPAPVGSVAPLAGAGTTPPQATAPGRP